MILANPPQAAAREECARPMDAAAPLRLWHLASLDAPTVAVTWAWAFAHAAHVALPLWTLALLGLVVWAIYIGDRILDALPTRRPARRHSLQERHYFHWRHRWVLAPLAVAAAGAALWLVSSRLSGLAIGKDSLVAMAALAYFSGVHGRDDASGWMRRFAGRVISRELVVGIIFSAGCVLPLLSVKAGRSIAGVTTMGLLCAAVMFALVAWLNVRAIGCWEAFAPDAGRVRVPALVLAIAGGGLCLGFAPVLPGMAMLLAAGAAGAALLGLLDCGRARLTPLALRIAADAVLLTPLVLAIRPLAG